ncbi:hypothetical protein [Streptomyces liliifuscus]|uniref:Uncharacterized protein n=1 Tax=Streptomyces liliifuscus TaxID=2797636 RepID=A0A7T7RFY0_9ACTN|nr:hypothetical protein [Streptomyces liliifuscus]QQM45180.1 hypothetical protein JEQ17_41115 [Streptomyces liliifuscus]
MIGDRDRIDIVLDVFSDPDAYRVVMVGAFEPGRELPPVPEGATRNVVQSFMGMPMNTRAFRLGIPAGDAE